MKTIERMTLAAEKYPALADYALFYLGSAQRDSGDNQSAAATFRRLSYGYPQSVFADEASLQYADLEFKLGRLGDARTAAAALAARNPAPDLDSQARLIEARAALGLGDALRRFQPTADAARKVSAGRRRQRRAHTCLLDCGGPPGHYRYTLARLP